MTRRLSDLPLFAWSQELRANHAKRRRLRRRAAWLASLAAALTVTIAVPPRPLLVWNASASAPIGLYWIGSKDELHRGDMVVAWVPKSHRMLAARRQYLPLNVPIVKRIAALPGDRICAFGRLVFVNYERVATRRSHDRAGRKLPWWRGCMRVRDGASLLLMDHPDSFDGRYFGPTSRGDLIGKASLIWRR
ncbi:MAG: S26 family signal peptidase [Pseudomonadota bacterium]